MVAAGVVPAAGARRLAETGAFTPAGVLAGALGVSEIFQRLRGGMPMAGRRSVGLDLWRPERDWLRGEMAPELDRLPSAAWLVGMGNLGQAYLWTLGLLPYSSQGAELVLQDFDVLASSNLSTSLLTTQRRLGLRKTRAMADWAEARGFKAAIVERRFDADFHVGSHEPPVGLIGVDNALARQSLEEVGFERVIEAGPLVADHKTSSASICIPFRHRSRPVKLGGRPPCRKLISGSQRTKRCWKDQRIGAELFGSRAGPLGRRLSGPRQHRW